ncbi:hypothetical protein J2X69_001216 [Algoriphagus sp. 4150]|nr:hypothetical protein [Algoriphagus sp. 4150]
MITAGMTRKMTWLLVSEKLIGPVGFGIFGWLWEYDMHGIRRNAKRKTKAEEIYFESLFIIIVSGFYYYRENCTEH